MNASFARNADGREHHGDQCHQVGQRNYRVGLLGTMPNVARTRSSGHVSESEDHDRPEAEPRQVR